MALSSTPALSSPGIGSGLQVNDIVDKLMAAEAAPLAGYDRKAASYQAKVSAFGSLTAAVGVFQSALGGLTSANAFKGFSTTVGNKDLLTASASAKAVAGNYKINVTQLAQAQTLMTTGLASKTSTIGLGGSTTLSFQFGSASGSFGLQGTGLSSSMLTNGLANGSLSINGTAIATSSGTNSATALANAINDKTSTTGVTASVANIFSTFGDVATDGTGSYALKVGNVTIASQGAGVAAGAGVTAASLDADLANASGATATALAAAGITFTGSAAAGTLEFRSASGASVAITETASGVTGGAKTAAGAANAGATYASASSVTLTSANGSPITIAGNNPAAAGLTAGTGGSMLGGGFSQDASQPSGSVVIDSTNNTLQGVADAINKASLGVTATIVSDGSASPYRLVLTSNKTGENAAMKISLSGDGSNPPDAALNSLLSYDPAGTQSMQQTSAAQDTKLTVNGIAVSSHSNTVNESIQGVGLTVNQVGSTTLNVARDTNSVKTNLTAFVKAYNELNGALKKLTAYDPETKKAGALQGDPTAQSMQAQLRRMMSGQITGLSGSLTNMGQVGISFAKDGTLSLDDAKLNKAIEKNFGDIAGLFTAIGNASDPNVSFVSSTAKTKPGSYALNITALASQGALTSSAALGSTTIAANTTWAVTLNDTSPSNAKNIANVTIPAGTYAPAELAKIVQSTINGTAAFADTGSSVTAAIDGSGKLVLSSSKYGSASNIALTSVSGSTVDSVFGGAAPVAGTDVAGTLGGKAVVGTGQSLTGAEGTDAEGLKIDITGGALGDRGTVSFSQGYAYQLNNLATSFLGSKGLLTTVTDGLNKSIKDVAKQRDAFSSKLDDIEKRYRTQFTRLDATLAKMQSTQAYLTQQLAAIASNS
ncbi:flagellar hook-associated protein 2 [Duganella sp. CF458]|uniref:flagellar filament capping protein FliD n=1 Tax=Duganella sp. CF458 TaxID=1884368 RepID=UPI0008DF6AC5|nr:flagellar filament capping protein FliD [Duganella sp. CF458]SFG57041.1 flagellar hook-associated protein 2 [Duganella sp. CF458]